MTRLRGRAFAKINVTLRVLGTRADGFHELRTVFQSLALHDTLIVERALGPFRIVCSDPDCPADERNLVWKAADALARRAGRRSALRDLRVRITKRIPMQAGLGGGSSDAAAALRLLARAWGLTLEPAALADLGRSLGADVPYFLEGGTALGAERGDVLFALDDLPPMWVVVVVPPFGVSTKDAYGWWDHAARSTRSRASFRAASAEDRVAPHVKVAARGLGLPACELRNDLEGAVVARRPEIARIVRALRRGGADYAAMSGSGSAVFGLFASRAAAAAVVSRSARTGRRVILTRTLPRPEYASLANSR